MQFSDDLEQATRLAAMAMRLMAQHRVAATPENFSVWYAYASERHPDLRNAIDALIAGNQAFTEVASAALFDKYLGALHEGFAIQETGEQMSKLVNIVADAVGQASEGARRYGDAIAGSFKSLSAEPDRASVREVLKVLAGETHRMLEQNRTLREQLRNSSDEIRALKENLVSLQQEALTDSLTGIANRKRFDASLRRASEAAVDAGQPLCLILCDIDHFKRFNDTYGHQTGDQVLRFVASVLSQSAHQDDTVARFGGEEFAMILPQKSLAAAVAVAETIREWIARKRLRRKQTGEEVGSITLSLGVAQFHPGESLRSFIKRTDDSLYHAKHTGRNRVVAETDLSAAA